MGEEQHRAANWTVRHSSCSGTASHFGRHLSGLPWRMGARSSELEGAARRSEAEPASSCSHAHSVRQLVPQAGGDPDARTEPVNDLRTGAAPMAHPRGLTLRPSSPHGKHGPAAAVAEEGALRHLEYLRALPGDKPRHHAVAGAQSCRRTGNIHEHLHALLPHPERRHVRFPRGGTVQTRPSSVRSPPQRTILFPSVTTTNPMPRSTIASMRSYTASVGAAVRTSPPSRSACPSCAAHSGLGYQPTRRVRGTLTETGTGTTDARP